MSFLVYLLFTKPFMKANMRCISNFQSLETIIEPSGLGTPPPKKKYLNNLNMFFSRQNIIKNVIYSNVAFKRIAITDHIHILFLPKLLIII